MSFEALFENASRLPSIPKVLQELILSFSDPDIELEKIAQKVALEPVLTAKILRVANSARYGSPRKISSVHEATVLLGFSAVRQMVLACGLVDALAMPEGFDKQAFWRRTFSVAGCCKWLCQYSNYNDSNTAFTAGLIHSMGQLLMYVVYPDKAKEVVRKMEADGLLFDAQEAVYGYNHCVAGAELARRWRFPDPICDALAQQHAPMKFAPVSPLAVLLHISSIVVSPSDNENPGNEPQPSITSLIPNELAEALQLDTSAISEQIDEINYFDGGMSSLLED